MNILKNKIKRLSIILVLLFLMTALLPIAAFAAELSTTTATIMVENKLLGDTPSGVETFTYTLTPDDVGCPMPEGTNESTITIKGAGTAAFGAITYSEPNTYTYTVREIAGNAANYAYDQAVYKATVYVTTDDTGNLTAEVWVTQDGADGKYAGAVFANSYKRPTDPNHPQTGDTNNLTLWMCMAGCSAAALLVLLIIMKLKKQSRQS